MPSWLTRSLPRLAPTSSKSTTMHHNAHNIIACHQPFGVLPSQMSCAPYELWCRTFSRPDRARPERDGAPKAHGPQSINSWQWVPCVNAETMALLSRMNPVYGAHAMLPSGRRGRMSSRLSEYLHIPQPPHIYHFTLSAPSTIFCN